MPEYLIAFNGDWVPDYTDEEIRRDQRAASDDARITRCDVEGRNLLMLILAGVFRIKRVGHVER